MTENSQTSNQNDRKFDMLICPVCCRTVGSFHGEVNALVGLIRHMFAKHNVSKQDWMEVWWTLQNNRKIKEEYEEIERRKALFKLIEVD